MYDPFRREWYDVRLALSYDHLWWVILMSTIVYNMPRRPWESCAYSSRMVAMAKDYSNRGSWNNQLFSALYDNMCNDISQDAIGSVAHKELIFNAFTESNAFEAKGSKVALRRWLSWIDAAHLFDPLYNSRLLV